MSRSSHSTPPSAPRVSCVVNSGFAFLGHLAIWVGCYVGGCVLLAGLLLHEDIPWRSLAIAIPITIGTYLVDRVRLGTTSIDPSDQMAHAARARVLDRGRLPVWTLAIAMIALAVFLAARDSLPVLVAVIGAPIGVVIYGHRGFSRRPKDRLHLKNAFVSVSIVSLVVLLEYSAASVGSLVAVAGFLLLHVFADAMLCDLDDMDADQRFGTSTIPIHLGEKATWSVAFVLNGIAFLWIILFAGFGVCPWLLSLSAGGCLFMATVCVHLLRPHRVKDLVDLKLPVGVLAACLLTLLLLA